MIDHDAMDPFAPAMFVIDQAAEVPNGRRGVLDNDLGRYLCAHAGVSFDRFCALTERRELLPRTPGLWPARLARDAARRIVEEHRGQRIIMLGPNVSQAFARALGHGRLPIGAELVTGGVVLVRLPYPLMAYPSLPGESGSDAVATIGRVVRGELDRVDAAQRSWCAMGGGLYYAPVTGRFACELKNGEPAFEPTLVPGWRFVLRQVLAEVAARVPRWGGMADCYVLSHSLDASGRAWQLAAAAGESLTVQVAAGIRGAAHDLHECLPLHGDVPGPVCRLLRVASPAWRRLSATAEAAVAREVGIDPTSEAAQRAAPYVKQADLDCRAAERAFVFKDAPAWLGPRGQTLAARGLTMADRTRGDARCAYTTASATLLVEHLINALDGQPVLPALAPCTLLPVTV